LNSSERKDGNEPHPITENENPATMISKINFLIRVFWKLNYTPLSK
jgi:hypothetical protein